MDRSDKNFRDADGHIKRGERVARIDMGVEAKDGTYTQSKDISSK